MDDDNLSQEIAKSINIKCKCGESMKQQVVQAMQKWIEEHIQSPITLQQMASVFHYSPFYLSRLFKEVTGMNLFDYIRKIRLTKAAKVLRDQSTTILDVAFDFVFDSHEGFTRAFVKEFHLTPKVYQQTHPPLPYFIPYLVTSKPKEVNLMNTQTIFVQIIQRPARKALIKRATTANDYFSYCEEVGCDVWGILTSVKEAIHEPIGMWLSPAFQKENTSVYVQGVEVPLNYAGMIPTGFELIDLPACEMVLFQGESYDDADYQQAISQVMEAIEKYKPEAYGFSYDENGYRFQYEPMGYRGYIEGRVIQRQHK